MAGNFWNSSHAAQWILDKTDLLRTRHDDLQVLSEEEYQKVIIFFANFMQVIQPNAIDCEIKANHINIS